MAGRAAKVTALAAALAGGATVKAAAAKARVSERSVYRALKNKNFQRRVRLYRAQIRDRVAGQLADACDQAIQTLVALLKWNVPATARLGAAKAVLEHTARVAETVELEARVAELELAAERDRNAKEYAPSP
jgi:hypothetical protein